MSFVKTGWRVLIAGLILPFLFSGMMYIGVATNYTVNIFDEDGFHQQFDNGIYKYRVLGKWSLLQVRDMVAEGRLPAFKPGVFHPDRVVDPVYYAAYFFNNSFYLMLACLAIISLLLMRGLRSFQHVEVPVLFLALVMSITQYVIVPYDTPAYWLLGFAALLTVAVPQTYLTALLFAGVVTLAMLNRETAFISLCFYLSWHYRSIFCTPVLAVKPEKVAMILGGGGVLAMYVYLRMALGMEQAMYDAVTWEANLHLGALAGFLFYICLLSICFVDGVRSNRLKLFALFSFPYVLLMVCIARPEEFRLWVPLIVLLVLIKTIESGQSAVGRASVTAQLEADGSR